MVDSCCEACRNSIVSSREKALKCSGPCAMEFHAFCADLNLSYWKASSAGVGLLWFCSKCREDLGWKQAKVVEGHRLEDVQEVEALELLPVKIWTKVFQSLSGCQLRQIRLTCRSWNRIVGGSSSLMNKFVLRLPKDTIMDQNCAEVELLSSCKSRYSHIILDQIRIIQVNSWWPLIAANLESLSITKCQITITTLLTMLGSTHNLKSLTFTSGLFFDANDCPTEVNFALLSLEKLILYDVDQAVLLDVFRRLCPGLKMFKIISGSCVETHPQKVFQLIRAAKSSLKAVELPAVQSLWQSITTIDGLNLKGISLKECTEHLAMTGNHVVNLSLKYPSVEALALPQKLFLNENTLQTIGRNLVDLRYLRICHNTREYSGLAAFLQQMPQLIRIDIVGNDNYYGSAVDFSNVKNNNLRYMNLSNLKISKSYSASFPNLTTINLNKCTIPSWSQIFDSKLKALQCVTLQSVRFEKREECIASYFNQMHYLSMTDCSVSECLLIALVSLCPNLTEIRLLKIDAVNDAVVLVLCQKLKNLRKITIQRCYKTTKLTQEYIEMYCRAMESIRFDKKHVNGYREEYTVDDYDYSGGHEFVYDYSF